MKKSLKIALIVSIVIIILALILTLLYFREIPCGGMTEDGALWDGKCRFGPIFMSNLKNGHFINPFKSF
jgi:hypothetical protein